MDQEKIGKFILKRRLDKGLTQKDLADSLGVTDKAISKWENGRCMPDISLLIPLSQKLDVTINEIIKGELIDSKEYKKLAEENLEESLVYKKKVSKLKTFLICSVFFLFFGLLIAFLVNASIDKTNYVDGYDYLYDIALNTFLEEVEQKDKEKDSYHEFNAYHSFGVSDDGEFKYVYMYIRYESDYIEDYRIATSNIINVPVRFTFLDDKVIKYEVPYYNDYNVNVMTNEGSVNEYNKPNYCLKHTAEFNKIFPIKIRNLIKLFNEYELEDKITKFKQEYYGDLANLDLVNEFNITTNDSDEKIRLNYNDVNIYTYGVEFEVTYKDRKLKLEEYLDSYKNDFGSLGIDLLLIKFFKLIDVTMNRDYVYKDNGVILVKCHNNDIYISGNSDFDYSNACQNN